MLTDALKQLDFTPNQIKIYLTLFDLGESRAGSLSKKTGLHRHIVYTVLDELTERKLVTQFIKSKIQYYQAVDPGPLLLEIQEKQKIAAQTVKDLRTRQKREPQEITIYEGLEGIKQHRNSSFNDLKKGEEILVMGVSNASNDPLKEYWREYHKKREIEGIKARMLWDPQAAEEGQSRKKVKGTEIKYLKVAADNPTFIEIWKDHVGIGVLQKNPFVISIDDKQVAQSFKSYFESLWNQENFVITGWEEATNYFINLYKELPAGEEQLVIAQHLTTVNKKRERKFWTEVNKPRIKKGLIIKCLHHPDDHPAYLKTMIDAGDPDLKKTEFRVSKTHAIQAPMSIEIFSDQVVTIHWHGNKPTLFILKGKDIAESYKKYWLGLWQDGRSLE